MWVTSRRTAWSHYRRRACRASSCSTPARLRPLEQGRFDLYYRSNGQTHVAGRFLENGGAGSYEWLRVNQPTGSNQFRPDGIALDTYTGTVAFKVNGSERLSVGSSSIAASTGLDMNGNSITEVNDISSTVQMAISSTSTSASAVSIEANSSTDNDSAVSILSSGGVMVNVDGRINLDAGSSMSVDMECGATLVARVTSTGLAVQSGKTLSGAYVFDTATSDPGGPATGQSYYNTSTNELRIYNGSAWRKISTSA